jgi:hypothetical protein
MSQADAKSFVDRMGADEALRRDLIGELEGGSEISSQRLAALGARHGLTFTVAELDGALAEWRKTNQAELSESALQAVSGGMGVFDVLQATQMESQMESRRVQTISNILKAKHDVPFNTIDNFK